MSAQGDPAPVDPLSGRLRWLGRAVVLAIGLWFIADGLSVMWPAAGTVARAMIVTAVVLGVVFAVVGLRYLARRGKPD